MGTEQDLPRAQRWARMRFAVIGPLLADPPAAGALRARWHELAAQTWTHPVHGRPVRFSLGSIRRWYYACRDRLDPTTALCRASRRDRGHSRRLDASSIAALTRSYHTWPSWSYLLHYDNFLAGLNPEQRRSPPSYATVRRCMRQQGLIPRHHPADRHATPAAEATRERFAQREVRQYEHAQTHALWHIDAHHGSLALSHAGVMQRPALIAVLDDHSRLICHAQWYWHENAASAAHTLSQAIDKRGLPRMLLSDNGGPFVAAEISQGLHRLGIVPARTLCYAPNQNGKMEVFWGQVEGRLLAMLRHERDLDLYRLNTLTLAWIEHDYHRRIHAGIQTTPLMRYQDAPDVGRPAPDSTVLTQAFTRRASRRPRRSDCSLTVAGKRFDLPSRYRHLQTVMVRYASWDLDHVYLAHPETDAILDRLLPVDREAHASGLRRAFDPPAVEPALTGTTTPGLPSLLQAALDASQASGLPPAFLPVTETPASPPTQDASHGPSR